MTYEYLWPSVAAFLYACGAYLHYIHVQTVFHLLDRVDEMNTSKAVMNSIVWPVTVIEFVIEAMKGDD